MPQNASINPPILAFSFTFSRKNVILLGTLLFSVTIICCLNHVKLYYSVTVLDAWYLYFYKSPFHSLTDLLNILLINAANPQVVMSLRSFPLVSTTILKLWNTCGYLLKNKNFANNQIYVRKIIVCIFENFFTRLLHEMYNCNFC